VSALDSHGQFYQAAKSYWATVNNDNDGGEVENGGVGEVLMDRNFTSKPRKIYTYLKSDPSGEYTSVSLTHSSNEFNKTNITPSALGLGVDTDPVAQTERNKLVDYVYGYDAYSSIPNQKRDWILGSFLHSRPFIIPYGSSTVIYAGSNDGMLHAFDASNGEELWAFIPPNLLNKLQALHLDVNEIFVDGSPKAYIESDDDGDVTKAILIFGQRRGGDRYIALDVSTPTSPKFLWEIGPSAIIQGLVETPSLDYSELGQTWSTPRIGFINDGGNKKAVMFVGGGYDPGQDNDSPPADTKGRAVYIVDVLTGSRVARFSNQELPTTMTYSIPSDVAAIDVNGDGKIDRLYVGDMGGQMWRFDITADVGSSTGKIVFKSNPGRDGSAGRKIFYAPDVSLEREVVTISGIPTAIDYEMLYFGTGDREHPNDISVVNRLYAIKDRNPSTPLTEDANVTVDVTEDLLQEPTTSAADLKTIRENLKKLNGWFIKLDQYSGEKSLSSAVIFFGVVYYTTFTPNTEGGDPSADPCYVGEGKGRLYSVDWATGNAVFDNYTDNNVTAQDPETGQNRLYYLRRRDREGAGGVGIPSNPIITFIEGQTVGYVGISDGIQQITLKTGKSLVPIYWYLKGGQ
jgi:type IV pilus assembly protein PilY1